MTDDEVAAIREGSKLRDGHGGKARGTERPGYAGHDGFGPAKNELGDLGEKVYSITTGLAMNEDVIIGGVKGDDFPDGINVKTTPFIDGRCNLIVEPASHDQIPPSRGYACVAIMLDGSAVYGVILGWASNKEVTEAPMQDYGYGPKLSIHHTSLHRPLRWIIAGAFP